RTGRLVWHDQVTQHDVRDYDFEATPVLADGKVFGAGKAGRVLAWDASTHRRLWETSVGLHRNDVGPLPPRRSIICPGLLGGVETPLAYADGSVYVPGVDLFARGSATSYDTIDDEDATHGRGWIVALDADTGGPRWRRTFPSPDFGCATVAADVVFTSTFDGTVYALAAADGRTLWKARLAAGINACPAVAGDALIVGAGVPRRGATGTHPEVVAFELP